MLEVLEEEVANEEAKELLASLSSMLSRIQVSLAALSLVVVKSRC